MRSLLVTALCTAALLFTTLPAAFCQAAGQPPELVFQKEISWNLPYQPLDFAQSTDGSMVFVLTTNQRVLIYEADGTLKGSIPVDSGVSSIDTDIRGEHILLLDSQKNSFTVISFDFILDLAVSGSPFLGSAEAPVTITVFTNFQCPYCQQLEPLLAEVLKANPETVKIVFKHMPLQGRDLSDYAALASFAAGKQGKFWEFHDRAFAAEQLSRELIDTIAADLGLNQVQFKADINSAEVREHLQKDASEAKDAGVRGTPTVFINGQRLKNRSLQGFQELIEQKLSQAR